ncbi:MAG: AAA family ATPase, partial [Candidatus Thorarchaeota archaeon]
MDVPLWSIKYRPKKWEDLVGQDRAVSMLRGLVQSGTCPNLLLFGPSGTGKSSAALILANEFLGELVDTNLLYLNVRDLMTYPISKAKRTLSDLAKLSREERSSMDEYMSMVYREASEMLRARGESGTPNKSQLLHAAIFIFASTMTVSQERVKLMILDEADALDDNMQQALRRTMEIYSNACRFVMIAQSVSGWNPAVISRCAVVRFPALDQEVIRRHLAQIAQAESVEVEPHAMSAICRVANGDLRRAIDILQLATCA